VTFESGDSLTTCAGARDDTGVVKIRTATIEDAPLLASLGANVQRLHHEKRPDWFKPVDETTTVDWYREMLMNPAAAIYLAEDADEAIGFVIAVVYQRLDTPFGRAQTVLEVDQIGVAPSQRRRGVGRALFKAVRELANQVSAERITLTTWSFNVEAHRFFEAEGLAPELHRMTMPWPALKKPD